MTIWGHHKATVTVRLDYGTYFVKSKPLLPKALSLTFISKSTLTVFEPGAIFGNFRGDRLNWILAGLGGPLGW